MKGFIFKALVALLVVCTLTLSSVAAPAIAQEEPPAQAEPTSSDPEANLPYLFAVYAITWVAFFAYLFYLSQKQRELRRELEELRRFLAERESQGEGPRHPDTG